MDQNERRPDSKVTIDKDAQISVVVNRSGEEEASIDLGRVFHNMKTKRRVFAWVLVLCMVVGLCAPLLMYQFNKPMLTVSSAVTLKYEVAMVRSGSKLIPLAQSTAENPEIVWVPLSGLTAPDGSELDLSSITSAYVLQQALNGMELSQPVSLSALRKNISIEKVLTDESRQAQELARKMVDDKNTGAYQQIGSVKMEYDTRFVVRLKNGFVENEEDKVKLELTDAELRTLLDRILTAYNTYLAETYADRKLPDNDVAEIDTDELDLLESLDQLQAASDNLYNYCRNQKPSVRAYRSYRDGRSLEDWMATIRSEREVSIDYLYTFVYANSLFKKAKQMETTYQNKLRNNDLRLQEVADKIEADTITKRDNYTKPAVIVSMQESGTVMTTRKTPDSYNDLVLRLADNYDRAVRLELTGIDLKKKIARLSDYAASNEEMDQASAELEQTKATFEKTYNSVRAHMEEVLDSAFYTTYTEHTVPQGKLQNFLEANLKMVIIGTAAGAVIACGLWFLAALAPEFPRNRKKDEDGKEAAQV